MATNGGREALVAYFYLLNLLNRLTIKLPLIEKTNSTIIFIPFVFSNIFTSTSANIFYHSILINRKILTKLQYKIKRFFSSRLNSSCLDVVSNNGEYAIVKNIVKHKVCRGKFKTCTNLIQKSTNKNLRYWKLFYTTAQAKLTTTCSIIGQQAVAQFGLLLCKNKDKQILKCAMGDVNKPIAVSKYQLIQTLAYDLKLSLPTTKEIEDEINKETI